MGSSDAGLAVLDMTTTLRSYGLTDVGRCRPHNEDSLLSDDDIGFYVVADGVGGRAKGEIASSMAVEEAHGYLHHNRASIDAFGKNPSEHNLFAVRRMLESAVQAACYMVFGLAEQDPSRHGMSTTMSALLILDHQVGLVAQVGDSRVYRLRGDECEQITEDHTLINYRLKKGLITPEEAASAPGKNIITRAVGHKDYVHVDTIRCDLRARDRFLLCSDGLHGALEDDEIATMLGDGGLEDVCRRLVALANKRGGKDNITVVAVDLGAA